jgi:hypothetical protein
MPLVRGRSLTVIAGVDPANIEYTTTTRRASALCHTELNFNPDVRRGDHHLYGVMSSKDDGVARWHPLVSPEHGLYGKFHRGI